MSHVLTLHSHWILEQLKTRLFQDEDDAFSDQFGPISETSNLIKNVKIIQSHTLNFAAFVGANLFIAPAEVAKFKVRDCSFLLNLG